MNKWLLIPLVVAVLLTPLLLKGLYVDEFIFQYTNTRLLGFFQVLANDAVIYAALIGLLYLSYLPPMPLLFSAVLRLAALLVLSIYVVDVYVIVNFNTHLTLQDCVKYIGYSTGYVQQIYGIGVFEMLLMAAILLLALSAFAFSPFKISGWRRQKLPLLLVAALPLVSGFTDNDLYTHAWIYRNVFDYNLTIQSESTPYSEAFAEHLRVDESSSCLNGAISRHNIIIVMVESLSAYQSRFFSGIEDWTPNLDAIAERNLAFTNFYANGFVTEDGEIALLTGLLPIYPPASYNDDGGVSFASFYGVEQSLPKLLKPLGYRSEFLTTADLDFGNTGVWAHSIGFDYVEGHEHPDYARWPRFQFKAAPDEALYRRALDRLGSAKAQPLLLFIKTVSSHHPYLNPENQHRSEAEVFQYADRQLGQFYRQLQAAKFFDNGVLLIVGDHHALTPLKPEEALRLGHYKASAKVPLVVVGGENAPRLESRQFQQTDVFNTLQAMVTGRQCRSDWQGILWGEHSQPANLILHRRGDNRDKISVFTATDDYLLKLDGDATRVVSKQPQDSALRKQLVDKVNALRIVRSVWAQREKSAERSD